MAQAEPSRIAVRLLPCEEPIMFISPHAMTGGLVWFPRMLGKIRLRAEGRLPEVVWNEYMSKRGWRDTDVPQGRVTRAQGEVRLRHRADILAYFDFYEVEEGRKP